MDYQGCSVRSNQGRHHSETEEKPESCGIHLGLRQKAAQGFRENRAITPADSKTPYPKTAPAKAKSPKATMQLWVTEHTSRPRKADMSSQTHLRVLVS